MSRGRRFLGMHTRMPWGREPSETPTEFVPRTEQEEARRSVRDWLRDRDESDVIEFEDDAGDWSGAC